jgi:hypothetical protein
VSNSTIVPVFGRGRQATAFGCTKVRGYHPQHRDLCCKVLSAGCAADHPRAAVRG